MPDVRDPSTPSSSHGIVTAFERDLLERAFAAYNAGQADELLDLVGDGVDWPDGARRRNGKPALRAYWAEQWKRTRTHDQPRAFIRRPDGRIAVELTSIVQSRDGAPISQGTFTYVFRIDGCHIVRLDIEDG